ncbi:MAG: hypothetical protein ACRDLL_05820 [Solirubrobacterales bacterium]
MHNRRSQETCREMRDQLRECAMLLVGAMSSDGVFPADLDGITSLIRRAVGNRQDHAGMPRYIAERSDESACVPDHEIIGISAAGGGALALRAVQKRGSISTSVVLHPTGRLDTFNDLSASDLSQTETVTDVKAHSETEQRNRDLFDNQLEAHPILGGSDIERFDATHLRSVQMAPYQDPSGLVITWIALYDVGVLINYLTPRPMRIAKAGRDQDRQPESRVGGSAPPVFEVRDDAHTTYSLVAYCEPDHTLQLVRGYLAFSPGVPRAASHLIVNDASRRVLIPLAQQ